ncbi:ClpP-like prohead protease/major capsid protein fusion protein [Motilimonas cestriensis]|uniref:ClpP-like prohead protease/major capsid protein fusion protein n=1 Tax=Motilimonas cestriensis TaxID=2742685 RepID=UPI003DA24615
MPKKQTWFAMSAVAGVAEIVIFDEIGRWGVSAKSFKQDLDALGKVSTIKLLINSPGGSVFEGLAIYNQLKAHSAYVEAHIIGLSASMATIIPRAADKVVAYTNTMHMIHNPWGGARGEAKDLRKYADLLDQMKAMMIPIYQSAMGLEHDEIATLMDDETWYTGEQALAAGLVDELLDAPEEDAEACWDKDHHFARFKHAPDLSLSFNEQAKQDGGHVDHAQELQDLLTNLSKAKAIFPNFIPSAGADPKPKGNTMPDPVKQPAAPAAGTAANAATSVDLQAFLAKETQRKQAIRAAFEPFKASLGDNYQTMLDANLDNHECSAADANAQLLKALGAQSDTDGAHGKNLSARVYAGNGNLVGDSVKSSILARVGLAEKDAENHYNGFTLQELARASLSDRGVGSASLDRMGMVGMAFTHSSSDFGNILLDVAHKSLLRGYEQAPETFEKWTRKGILTDFKKSRRVDLNTFKSLRKVGEGSEYKYAEIGDRGEEIMLLTLGELFSITRQAIINDDLGVLSRIPMKMGRAARASIGDMVYAQLTKGGKMSDGKDLWHADRKNTLAAGMDVAGLTKGMQLMQTQKDGETHLNINPAYLLTPVALGMTAKQVIGSTSVAGADVNAGIINPIKDQLQVITESRLDSDSAAKFYMAAGDMYDTIEVAYLDGVETPFLEQQQGFTIDGVVSKIRLDVGVKAMDYRSLVKFN